MLSKSFILSNIKYALVHLPISVEVKVEITVKIKAQPFTILFVLGPFDLVY